MSSDDDERSGQDSKRRRIQRACDVCRRKKIRCDGMQGRRTRCTNCIDYEVACTYVEAAKKRAPPKSYIQRLEHRVEQLQDLLEKISPEALEHLETLPEGPISDISSFSNHQAQPQPQWPQTDSSPSRFIRQLGSGRIPTFTSNEEEDSEDFLVDHLEKLHIHTEQRFFGKSSGVMLVKTALELKLNYLDGYVGAGEDREGISSGGTVREWTYPVSAPKTPPPTFTFPPPDLLDELIDLYFLHMNTYLPLLHRPTFTQAVKDGLHLRDTPFATTVILVCAVAGRYSDDPRVMDDLPVQEGEGTGGEEAARNGQPKTRSAQSRGWKWFSQVSLIKTSPLSPSSLHELQFYALVAQFLQASSVPQACWTVVGMGVRVAQDVGAHRKNRHVPHTVEDELWKRAFWVLVCMDRLFSSSLGRPCSIHDEDFDVEMPIECDDEYWDHPDPELRWRQPTPEKTPSVVTYFNEYIRLNQILAFLLRTVYAVNKSKILLGFVGQEWEESIVSELDSALNAWVDDLPDHLRWDPTHPHPTFFNQSASLYCAYYNIQILVHRPFIPSPRKATVPLSFPSLAICTNAARACSHVVHAQGKRFKFAPPPPIQTAAFSAGVVLLLSIWGGKRAGLSTDFDREMADVKKCMDVLKASETRWFLAGRLYDVLCELASVGDLPLPQRSSASPASTAQKRDREDEPELEHNRTTRASPNSISYEELVVPGLDTMASSSTMIGQTGSVRRRDSDRSLGAAGVPLPLPQEQLYVFGEYESFDSEPVYAPPSPYQPHPEQSLPYQRIPHQTQFPQQYQRQQQRQSPGGPVHDGLVHPEYWYGSMGGRRPQDHDYGHRNHRQRGRSQSHSQARSIAADLSRSTSSSGLGARAGMGYPASSYYGPSAAELSEMSPFAVKTPVGAESVNPYQMGTTEASRGGDSAIGIGAEADMSDAPGMAVETLGLWSGVPAGFELMEWCDYVSSMSDMQQGQGQRQGYGTMPGQGFGG